MFMFQTSECGGIFQVEAFEICTSACVYGEAVGCGLYAGIKTRKHCLIPLKSLFKFLVKIEHSCHVIFLITGFNCRLVLETVNILSAREMIQRFQH